MQHWGFKLDNVKIIYVPWVAWSNLVSEWKLLSLYPLYTWRAVSVHRKQKIAPDVKQQNTAINFVMFRLRSRFNRTINIKCHSRCPYSLIVTRLVSALRKGSSICHIWVNVENLALQKNHKYFAKALTHGSCPLRLRSYLLALDRTDLYTAIGFSTSHSL